MTMPCARRRRNSRRRAAALLPHPVPPGPKEPHSHQCGRNKNEIKTTGDYTPRKDKVKDPGRKLAAGGRRRRLSGLLCPESRPMGTSFVTAARGRRGRPSCLRAGGPAAGHSGCAGASTQRRRSTVNSPAPAPAREWASMGKVYAELDERLAKF